MLKFACGLLLGVGLIPLVAVVIFLFGWAPVHATADPPHWETSLAGKSFAASIARQVPKLQNPVPAISGNLRTGLEIYRDDCSGCHGDSGKPSHWGTPRFIRVSLNSILSRLSNPIGKHFGS